MFRIENKSKIMANISGPRFFMKIEIIKNSNRRLPALKNDEKNKFLNKINIKIVYLLKLYFQIIIWVKQ